MLKSVYRSFAIILAIGCAQGAFSQDMFLTQMQGISNWQLSSNMATVNSIVNEENFGGKQRSTSHTRDSAPQQLRTVVTYTPSKSRTRANLQKFVNKSRASDPAGAAQMEGLFASTDVIETIGDSMSSVGLSRSSAGDAFAVYWISAWQAANGRVDTRSSETYLAAAAQAAQGLSASPEFAAANDAQKQEMAEALMVQAALIDAAMEQAASDPVTMKALAKAVKHGAAASGLELDKMTLTENGFVPTKARKRSDGSDAVSGEEKALAANDTGNEKDEGPSPTQLAMIAAAGGAGLGAVFLLGKVAGKKG